MPPTVKTRQRWDQLRTKTAHRKREEEEEEKSWCDKDRRETWARVLREKLNGRMRPCFRTTIVVVIVVIIQE
jgi:hypothetical protein